MDEKNQKNIYLTDINLIRVLRGRAFISYNKIFIVQISVFLVNREHLVPKLLHNFPKYF